MILETIDYSPTQPVSGRPRRPGVFTRIARAWRDWTDDCQAARDHAALMSLSDHLLDDIGVTAGYALEALDAERAKRRETARRG